MRNVIIKKDSIIENKDGKKILKQDRQGKYKKDLPYGFCVIEYKGVNYKTDYENVKEV